jgi:hypothetical protein
MKWKQLVRTAWAINPCVAVQLRYRFSSARKMIDAELTKYSFLSEVTVSGMDEALFLLKLEEKSKIDEDSSMRVFLEQLNTVSSFLGCQLTSSRNRYAL